MGPLTIAMGLAEIIPTAVRFFSGDKAAETAEQVVSVAQRVAGIDDPQEAVDRIRNDPELQIQLQQAVTPIVIARLEAETRRLEAINATMRAEAASKDGFVRRWRPTLGYIVSITWGVQMGALSWVIISAPDKAPAIIAAMGALTTMWGVALSILGISVSKRSDDKAVAAGQSPQPGILGTVTQRLMGGDKSG